MNSAIESNINLVNDNKPETDQSSSFLRSETVGIYTLVILHMLTKKKEEVDVAKIESIVRERIIAAQAQCNKTQDLTYGATGYLYVLLVLENKLRLYFESEKEKVEGLLKSLQDTISEVV